MMASPVLTRRRWRFVNGNASLPHFNASVVRPLPFRYSIVSDSRPIFTIRKRPSTTWPSPTQTVEVTLVLVLSRNPIDAHTLPSGVTNRPTSRTSPLMGGGGGGPGGGGGGPGGGCTTGGGAGLGAGAGGGGG